MTTLIVGGTGTTGLALAKLLHAADKPVLITSRKGVAPAPFKAVKFDWFDASTFGAPFAAAQSELGNKISGIYLVLPSGVMQPFPIVKPFIDLAVKEGVDRIVLVSASDVEKGDTSPMGKTHEYIVDKSGLGWAVLKPNWFMDNFANMFGQAIKYQNAVPTCCKDGKLPFIAAEDIAQAGFDAFVAEKAPNREYVLVGPEAFTYDEALALLSSIIGRTVTHQRLSNEEHNALLESLGLPKDYAEFLTALENNVAEGAEEFRGKHPFARIGKKTLKEYFEENKEVWAA